MYFEAKQIFVNGYSRIYRQIRMRQMFQGTTLSSNITKQSSDLSSALQNLLI